ncbi:MAG: hypothetical protein ABII13_01345 [Patescibacteria group bacterium]|nr:hypothetical protein [Patescibacteria group bacterium]MBU2509341.1 hypothetical protein [Patescibacteria group bacterium]
MDNVRKGEIAVLFLKHQLHRKGMRLGPDFRRELGNIAKAIDAPFGEVMEFAEELVQELVDKLFNKKNDEP